MIAPSGRAGRQTVRGPSFLQGAVREQGRFNTLPLTYVAAFTAGLHAQFQITARTSLLTDHYLL